MKVDVLFGWSALKDLQQAKEALACALNLSLISMGGRTSHAEEHTSSMIPACTINLSAGQKSLPWRNVGPNAWRFRVAGELSSISKIAESG